VINIVGVKQAGKANDILTILKLAPLLVFTVAGIIFLAINPTVLVSNFTPFLPLGLGGLGSWPPGMLWWVFCNPHWD